MTFSAVSYAISGQNIDLVKEWCRRLTFSSSETNFVMQSLESYIYLSEAKREKQFSDVDIYRYFKKFKEGGISGSILFLTELYQNQGTHEDYIKWCINVVLVQNLIYAYFNRYIEVIDPRPMLSGNDIQELLGKPAGPVIGKIKNNLIEAQINGSVKNIEEARSFVRLFSKELTD